MTRRFLTAVALLLVAAAPLAGAAPGKEKAVHEADEAREPRGPPHEPPGQAKRDEPADPPGQAKRDEPQPDPPGHVKREEPATVPPGHASRDEPATPLPEATPERAPEPATAEPAPAAESPPSTGPAHAPAAEPLETRTLPAPVPVPEARVEPLDQGIAAESRVPVAFPNPYAPPEEDDGGLFSPWGWALPILGLVGLGAALVSTRPGSVSPAAPPRAPGSFRVSPATLEGILRAGKDAVEQARFDEAVAWFTQAIKLDPRLPVAHFCLGVCLATMGRDEDAYAALRKAHRLDPREGAYRLELARAAARLGRHQEAMQQMAPLLRLLPDLAEHAGDDAAFASMRDHPRWLAMLGRL